MNTMPQIRIELQGLTESIIHAFVDRHDEIKNYAISAIDASLTQLREEDLELAIIDAVQEVMTKAIDISITEAVVEAVGGYFREGEGNKFIIDAIFKKLGGEDSKSDTEEENDDD